MKLSILFNLQLVYFFSHFIHPHAQITSGWIHKTPCNNIFVPDIFISYMSLSQFLWLYVILCSCSSFQIVNYFTSRRTNYWNLFLTNYLLSNFKICHMLQRVNIYLSVHISQSIYLWYIAFLWIISGRKIPIV